MRIRKAIIAVAGFGTRFLPVTKAQPKEMLPIVDKPVIQLIVEEAVAAGIEDIILITGQNKRAIEDHFDRNFELEYRLARAGKKKELEEVRDISYLANFIYVRQKTPLGDGHAILQARHLIGDEPVAVLFGDDIVDAKVPAIKQLMTIYERYQDPVLGVMRVPRSQIHHYGVIGGKKISDRTYEVDTLVEKPKPEVAPSSIAIVGKYIITPEVFDHLAKIKPPRSGEIRLIDGLREHLKTRAIFGYEFEGTRFDAGNKLEYVKANISYALKRKDLQGPVRSYIKSLIS